MATPYSCTELVPPLDWSLNSIILLCVISVQCARDMPVFFAHRLKESMSGLGTDEDGLIRVIICRSEVRFDCEVFVGYFLVLSHTMAAIPKLDTMCTSTSIVLISD